MPETRHGSNISVKTREVLRLNKEDVNVPSRLRDDNWGLVIGELQRDIQNLSSEASLSFNFTKCRWVDPLPALSLLVEMAQAKGRGLNVRAVFPPEIITKNKDQVTDANNNPPEYIDIYPKQPNKLLRFFAREGYFTALLGLGIPIFLGKKPIDDAIINHCSELDVELAYADPSFIKFHLFDVPKLDGDNNDDVSKGFAADMVAYLLSDVDRLLHTRCSPSERHHLLYTLRAVLQEFLHNAQEHAYPKDELRPVALYVRYRKGGVGLSSTNEKQFYRACVNQEYVHCLGTSLDWINARKGCLEVFFLDRGVGLSNTLPMKKQSQSDFEQAMVATFIDGESSKGEKGRITQHGGLHLLHNLLNRRHDYIRATEGLTWFGSVVPFEREQSNVARDIEGLELGSGLIGLAYHVRLSWKASTDMGESWLSFSGENPENINLLSLPYDPSNPLGQMGVVVDERFKLFSIEDIDPIKVQYILWLPKRNLMKWDILKRLERISKKISTRCRLIVADIPSIEAAVYNAAISESRFDRREEWPEKYEWIILATNRWTFAYASYYAGTRHGFSPLLAGEIPKEFVSGIKGANVQGAFFRQLVVDWVKIHDSQCFWTQAKKTGRLFLPEQVVWEEDENHKTILKIDGYMDFPAATHDRYCAQLFSNALARIFGFFPKKNIEFIPVDSLVVPVVHDVYANEAFDPPSADREDTVKLAVGSVLVSGETLEAIGSKDSSVHFFVHPSAHRVNQYVSLFYWLPEEEVSIKKPEQKRIGKSSAIAPEGWLSIEVPRYDKDGVLAGGRTPTNTYGDWQNPGPVILKAGHWCYEGHHDFLTLNIPDAVDDSFARSGPLAQFLVSKVLQHLGVPIDRISSSRFDFLPSDLSDPPGILVYRSHPSVERILEKVLHVLDAEVRAEVEKWIFPILPLRMRWGGSTLLLPPRTSRAIHNAFAIRSRVMIFDDAAISGRTIQDLLTSLRYIGASHIRILTIANRLRLPSETKSIEYYWRLDVPTMGREGSCPLCQALNAGRSFATGLVKPSEAFGTFMRWINAWEPASPLNNWHYGLDPLPLRDRGKPKKYCYRPSEKKYKDELDIFRSTGLMVHAAELHAMTATDNYGLRQIRKHIDPAIKIGVAASQLLLFGDEFDQDIIRDLLIEGLLDPLADLSSDSPYGPLALLVIMKVMADVSSKVEEAFVFQTKCRIDQLSESQHGQLLIAFLMSQEIISWDDNSYYVGTRLLSTRHRNIADKLRSLYRETIDSSGCHHSEPIPRLSDTLKGFLSNAQNDSKGLSSDLVWAALNSIASLTSVLEDLGTDLVFVSKKPSYEERRKLLADALEKAKKVRTLLDVADLTHERWTPQLVVFLLLRKP
ncbi:MAG: hypothetical protein COZ01_09550, partial [Zetaproteobacteria bacterium CG_4_10_14_0_8_um_filter_55_43]